MTDENQTYLDTLHDTRARLVAELKALNAPPEDGDALDRSPRNISATLKAIDDVQSQIDKAEEKLTKQTYSRWEDLPPPSPEDEARYYEDFKRIFRRVAKR